VCAEDGAATGTQFTCFTGAKVQILALLLLTQQSRAHCAQLLMNALFQFTCFAGAKVHILTLLLLTQQSRAPRSSC
jgi:hypothetical protein